MRTSDPMAKMAKNEEGFQNSIDGLWDIALGLTILVVTISIFFNLVVYTSGFYLVLFLLIRFLKHRLTYPRIGYATYKESRENIKKGLILSMVFGTVILIFMFLYIVLLKDLLNEQMRFLLQEYSHLLIGTFFSGAVFAIAKVFYLKQFYVYSLLMLLSFIAIPYGSLESGAPVSLIVCGSAIFLSGLLALIRFIRAYPKLEGDE